MVVQVNASILRGPPEMNVMVEANKAHPSSVGSSFYSGTLEGAIPEYFLASEYKSSSCLEPATTYHNVGVLCNRLIQCSQVRLLHRELHYLQI